jgi:hypothetical protein
MDTLVTKTFLGKRLDGNMIKFYLNPKNWFLSENEKKIKVITQTLDGEARDRAFIALMDDGKEKEIALLNLDLKHERINQNEYDHKMADLYGEPYVNVVKLNFDEKNPSKGYFELDFNDHFVEYLAQNGYEGIESEEIVNTWFDDLCKSIVYESLTDDEGVAKSFLSDSTEGQLVQRFPVGDNYSEYQ